MHYTTKIVKKSTGMKQIMIKVYQEENKDFSKIEKLKHINELKNILNKNKNFLDKYADLFKDIMLEYNKLVYNYEHYSDINKDKDITEEDKDNMYKHLKEIFIQSINQKQGSSIIDKVYMSVNLIKNIQYKDLKLQSIKK